MKILIISKVTYPLQSPRAFRTAELSEQLVKMGHDVTLYTVSGEYDYTTYENSTGIKMRRIKTRFLKPTLVTSKKRTFIDKALGILFGNLITWPDIELHFRMNRIIKDNPNTDLLITIAVPHQIHSGAARAKRAYPNLFPKKWICDCGDPFMLNPFFHLPKYMKYFEDMWCSACDYIAVPTKTSYKGYYKQYWDKIRVIPQGFDFSKTPVAEYKKNPIPTFLFTGSIHPGRSPQKFMDYLLTLDFDFKFYLYMRRPLDKKYEELSNGKIQYMIGYGRKDIVYACSKMDFLVDVKNINDSQTPSKLIDYGISGRPVLSISDNFSEMEEFCQFVKGDFSAALVVNNLDDYKIENVASKFLALAE